MIKEYMTAEDIDECLNSEELMGELMHELYPEESRAAEIAKIEDDLYEPPQTSCPISIKVKIHDDVTGHTWDIDFDTIDRAVVYLLQYKDARESHIRRWYNERS